MSKLLARIRIGAIISHDRTTFRWPECKPPLLEYDDGPYLLLAKNCDMVFEVSRKSAYWECTADGYGSVANGGMYDNGSIFVFNDADLEFLEIAVPVVGVIVSTISRVERTDTHYIVHTNHGIFQICLDSKLEPVPGMSLTYELGASCAILSGLPYSGA